MFDLKNKDIIVWNNQVVMSSTEYDYFHKLFSFLKKYCFTNVLEIGYGLGISAKLIQHLLKPDRHSIVEINEEIYQDLLEFSKHNRNVKPLHNDWKNLEANNNYDFVFSDPYDYNSDEDTDVDLKKIKKERFKALANLLVKDGVLCIPYFGDGYPEEKLYGYFHILDNVLVDVEPILMCDHTICNQCRILTYRKL